MIGGDRFLRKQQMSPLVKVGAKALIEFLSGLVAVPILKAKGFEPQ